MNDGELKLGNESKNKDKTNWDIDKIANEVHSDLNGSVALSIILQTLEEVIPRYKSARVQTFARIFIRREAVKQLQTKQADFPESKFGAHKITKPSYQQEQKEWAAETAPAGNHKYIPLLGWLIRITNMR